MPPELTRVNWQFIICADVIEHVRDPYVLLAAVRSLMGDSTLALISTPDRSRIPGAPPLGPPGNPRHVREWSMAEFELLLTAAGFDVVRRRHCLPRSYDASLNELKRAVYRVLHWQRVPDARYAMVFLVRKQLTRTGA